MLGACDVLPTGAPQVLRVDPADGETDVPTNVTVRAELSLPDGMINLTTLSQTTVGLTDAAGAEVEATRTLSDDGALIVDPTTDLEPNATYQFEVTPGLQTEVGTSFEVFSSSFTTGDGPGTVPDPSRTRNLVPDRERVVFSAGGDSSSDTRTLRLTNTGNTAINVSSLSISGDDASRFRLADDTTFALAPNASRDLELTFRPGGLGPQLATLTVTSDDSLSPTLEVPLGGLGIRGQGGNLEPSLQWIFDTYGLDINAGDSDPSSTGLVSAPTNGLVGDEVAAQRFVKATGAANVSVEVLAAFGVENDPVLEFGHYTAGSATSRQPLFEIQQTPTLNAQRLAPTVDGELDANGRVVFDPGTSAFGLYSFWPSNRFFSRRYVYSENNLNTFLDAIPHQVRTYPLKNPDGTVEPNAFVLATEEFTQGFDYNDIVVILRNVTPTNDGGEGIPDLQVFNTLRLPDSERLVLHHIANTSGNLCGPPEEDPGCDRDAQRWADLEVRDTGVVGLRNLGSTPLQLGLSMEDPNLFRFSNGESTLSLQPGESYDLSVQFDPSSILERGVYPSSLNVTSGSSSASLELVGIYFRNPEGGREVFLEGIVNEAFGYPIDLGANGQGGLSSAAPDSRLVGDEVRAAYWQAGSAGDRVTVTQIAAFHSCCTLDRLELFARGSSSPFAQMRHRASDSQTIYPRLEGESSLGDAGLTQLTTNARRSFEIHIAGYSTNPGNGRGNGNLGVRLWPLIDRGGRLLKDTYLVTQDFVENGCGTTTMANCDYNDNMYIIENIAPAD